MLGGMIPCENCGNPATLYRQTSAGEVPTCDRCKPGDWTGEARPLVETLPDLTGRKTLSKAEAAGALGVSVDYFDRHVMPELRVVSRGARVLVPVDALDAWVSQAQARALRR